MNLQLPPVVLFSALLATAQAQVDPVTIFTGDATTYTSTPGNWASSLPPAEVSTYYAAINGVQFGNSEWCGAWVEVTGPVGSAIVQIVDKCPECPYGDLDLSPAAFSQVTGATDGRLPISWKWVPAPGERGAVRFYSEGSNPYYLKLQVANSVNPPASMSIFHGGGYASMARTSDHHFVFLPSSGPISEPFTIKVTDIFGNELVSSGLTISGTAAAAGQNGSGNFPGPAVPGIAVELPDGTAIADNGSHDIGLSINGSPTSRQFTIRNLGSGALTGLTITRDGPHASSFSITGNPVAPVPPGGTTTFTISFAASTIGIKTAAIHIASNASPPLDSYDIQLTGGAFSSTVDTDGDGMNDAAEASLATLGFDWNAAQPERVGLYYANANLAGLHTPAEIRALQVGAPLLERDPKTGLFTLTLGLASSIDLKKFEPFPFTHPDISIDGSGKLIFRFSSPPDFSFFRVGAE